MLTENEASWDVAFQGAATNKGFLQIFLKVKNTKAGYSKRIKPSQQ